MAPMSGNITENNGSKPLELLGTDLLCATVPQQNLQLPIGRRPEPMGEPPLCHKRAGRSLESLTASASSGSSPLALVFPFLEIEHWFPNTGSGTICGSRKHFYGSPDLLFPTFCF